MCEENAKEGLLKSRFQISFDEATHTYTVDGRILPSVTQVMRSMSEDHYAAIAPDVLAAAADRGTRVHRAVEMFEKFGIETDDEEVKPYLLQYKIAKRLEGFTCIANELILTNGIYCGTIDIYAKHKGYEVLIDLKATSVINTPLIEVQLAGYDRLCLYNDLIPISHYVLQLKKDGYKFKMINPNDNLWASMLKQHQDEHR